jgi:hypothetical protein
VFWSNRHNTGNRDLFMDKSVDTGRLSRIYQSSLSAVAILHHSRIHSGYIGVSQG